MYDTIGMWLSRFAMRIACARLACFHGAGLTCELGLREFRTTACKRRTRAQCLGGEVITWATCHPTFQGDTSQKEFSEGKQVHVGMEASETNRE